MSATTTEAGRTMRPVSTFHIGIGEASGAVADLGVLVPLATALILVNGMSAGSVLLGAGLLYIVAGVVYRIPFPVQPLKALTAVAVAEQLAPGVINAAGIELGALLLLLSIGGFADLLAKIFTKPVVRALQAGVGVLLLIAAWKLVTKPPAVFASAPSTPWAAALAIGTLGAAWFAARSKRYWTSLAILATGIGASIAVAAPQIHAPSVTLPAFALPPGSAFATAFLLLVVPQLPLTFGNAVVAVNDLAHEEFGERARRVSPGRICLTDGAANVVVGLFGGMPMCHGAGGLTAHVKLGARTAGMNLLLGGVLATIGLLWAGDVPAILGLLPVWALGGFLAYAGIRHALLVSDLRGWPLAVAVVSAAAGVWFGNLAITATLALAAVHLPRLFRHGSASAGTLGG